MSNQIFEFGMGWLPDYPDFRDYTVEKEAVAPRLLRLEQKDSVKAMLAKVGVAEPAKVSTQTPVDLRKWCSPIEHQGALGSCTAHAGVGLVEGDLPCVCVVRGISVEATREHPRDTVPCARVDPVERRQDVLVLGVARESVCPCDRR